MYSRILLLASVFTSLLPIHIQASPLVVSRDVYDPPILSPDVDTVWSVGESVTVVWNITDLPPDSQLTRPTGTIVLGFETTGSLNLMIKTPLAEGFKLRDGKVNIVVPDVPTRKNYIVVLMGSSGNTSPQFTITGGRPAAATASSLFSTFTSSVTPGPPIWISTEPAQETTTSTFTDPDTTRVVTTETTTATSSVTSTAILSATSSLSSTPTSITPSSSSSLTPSTTPSAPANNGAYRQHTTTALVWGCMAIVWALM